MSVRHKPVRTGMYLKIETRDRINCYKARFTLALGRNVTQDESLAILMDAWDAQHRDSEAVRYLERANGGIAVGGPRQ